MSRKAFAVIVVAAIILTLFSFALSRRDSADWRSLSARRLFPFPWQNATTMTMDYPDGRKLEFAKDKFGGWRVRLDENTWDTLHPQAVEELAALVMLPWRDQIAGATSPDPATSPKLTAVSADGDKVTVVFGPVVGNTRLLGVIDDPGIAFGINPDLARVIDWPAERFRNLYLATVPPGWKIDRIVITPSPGQAIPLDLKKEGSQWILQGGHNWQVEPARLDMLFGWLSRLEAESAIATYADDPAWFGFGENSIGIEIYYETENGIQKRRIEFGKAVNGKPDLIYARVSERSPIFAVPRRFLSEIALEHANSYPNEWAAFFRKRTFALTGAQLPKKIVVESILPNPARLTIERTTELNVDTWKGVLETNGTIREFAIDNPQPGKIDTPLSKLLSGLSNIRIRVFLADGLPGQDTLKWTAYPAWRFTIIEDDNTTSPELTLYAIDPEGNLASGLHYVEGFLEPMPRPVLNTLSENVGIACSVSGSPSILEVDSQLSALLCIPPYRYHTTRMIDADPETWTKVIVKKEGSKETVYMCGSREYGEHWWRSDAAPEPLLDDNNLFVTMLVELSKLQAVGVVAPVSASPEEFGLDRPAITTIVYGTTDGVKQADSSTEQFAIQLDIGNKNDAGLYYARLNQDSVVFLLPEEMIAKVKKDYH